jgi:hypothetical protein
MREIEFLHNDNETVGTWVVPQDVSLEFARKKQDDPDFRKFHLRCTRPMVIS